MGVINLTPDSFSDGGRYMQRGRGGEEVEIDPQVPPIAQELRVISIDDLLRSDTLCVCFDGDRGAVHV